MGDERGQSRISPCTQIAGILNASAPVAVEAFATRGPVAVLSRSDSHQLECARFDGARFALGFFSGMGHVVLLKANVRSKGGPQPADHRGNVGHGRLAEPRGLSEILYIET